MMFSTSQFTTGATLSNPGTQYGAFAETTALPGTAYATSLASTAAAVRAGLMSTGDSLLGAGVIGGNFIGTTGTAETYNGSAQFNLPSGSFPSTSLMLGMMADTNGFSSNPSGFGSMSFEVSWAAGGATYDRTYSFTTLAAANTFFTDNVLDLGIVYASALTVNLAYTLTAQSAGSYDFDFLLGTSQSQFVADVPEPASGLVLLTATGGLAGLRRWLKKRRWLGLPALGMPA